MLPRQSPALHGSVMTTVQQTKILTKPQEMPALFVGPQLEPVTPLSPVTAPALHVLQMASRPLALSVVLL